MITNPIHAMKKTCYTLLVGLACVLTTEAQTNDTTASVPADTNSAPVAALTETNATPAPVAVETAPVADTNPPAMVAMGIPQIKFSDVPITTAIENLARLAGINYMLDPKIGYGLADANGQIKVEPTLSIRWENITAENALLALLEL